MVSPAASFCSEVFPARATPVYWLRALPTATRLSMSPRVKYTVAVSPVSRLASPSVLGRLPT